MNPKDKFTKARTGLILDMPFFGGLSLRLTPVEDRSCPTAWTDGKRLGYNPDFVNALSLGEVKGLIAHEVMHNALGHQLRRGQRNAKKWNAAADYAINGILEASKITLPKTRLLDPAFDGMSAEAIYPRLPDEQEGGDKGNSDPGGCGEVRDAVGDDGKPASEADVEREAAAWKIAVAQAAQQAKAMGAMPAALGRVVEEIVAAKVDWRETLRRFVQTAARNDYRWSPPNKRFAHAGLYLPSMRGEQIKDIIIAVDTSGSIGADTLAQFAGEVNNILEEYETTCHVVYCDADIQGIDTFTRNDLPLYLHGGGGGGTDFRPAFKWADAFNIDPACLVYLTDMEGTFPEEEPAYPVLWVNTGRKVEAPFGEVVKI